MAEVEGAKKERKPSILHDNPRSRGARGDDERKTAGSPKKEEKADESKSKPASPEASA